MIPANITILHRSNDWLAIDKPAGASLHNEDGQGLLKQLSDAWQMPLWPVHRLDKVTSGVLVVALSAEAAARFGCLFEQRRIHKYYLAISSVKAKKKQGWVKGDMVRSRNGCWKLTRQQTRPAVTRFISHFDGEHSYRHYLLKPETGRTHQLRVTMKSLGCPIDGDERYGGRGAPRTYLHAYGLEFEDSGQTFQLLCPPPQSWGNLPVSWQTPWQCFY
ncbi:putative RNA pseudouridine synthase [Bacterioplanes sanyensis]|uniref:pseudouridine synthase n=1 Tax=Bacterioplanes sanyensis TaxID=1249553 RepID=UPI001672288F|nr:pseudouridine synthase [Bacterioplanes sanyensis]GGY34934.1 putative RNA pseudouridine synthase [Bacterioplanes sanyensis]